MNAILLPCIITAGNQLLFKGTASKSHLTNDTNGKVTTSQLEITNESPEISPFPAGDHKASVIMVDFTWQWSHAIYLIINDSKVPVPLP